MAGGRLAIELTRAIGYPATPRRYDAYEHSVSRLVLQGRLWLIAGIALKFAASVFGSLAKTLDTRFPVAVHWFHISSGLQKPEIVGLGSNAGPKGKR